MKCPPTTNCHVLQLFDEIPNNMQARSRSQIRHDTYKIAHMSVRVWERKKYESWEVKWWRQGTGDGILRQIVVGMPPFGAFLINSNMPLIYQISARGCIQNRLLWWFVNIGKEGDVLLRSILAVRWNVQPNQFEKGSNCSMKCRIISR